MSTINKSYVVGVYLHLLLKSLEIGELGQQEGEQGAGSRRREQSTRLFPPHICEAKSVHVSKCR